MVAFWYIVFAIVSTAVNLLAQYMSFWLYDGFLGLYIAMTIGTLSGLVVKYILDKKYIFNHTSKTKREDSKKFALYSLMGVFTTLIFWGFEIFFDYAFDFETAKYIGAALGLSVGYAVKYRLDKRFVFGK